MMDAVEGQTPADAQRDDYHPAPNLMPNGANPGGQFDYGGPDCAQLALHGLDDDNPLCTT